MTDRSLNYNQSTQGGFGRPLTTTEHDMKVKVKTFGSLSQTANIFIDTPIERQPYIITAMYEGRRVKGFILDIFVEDGQRVVEFAAFKPFEDLIYISPADISYAEERIIERINAKQYYTNRTR